MGQLVRFLMEAARSVRFGGLMIRGFVQAIGWVLLGGFSAVAEDLEVVKWSGELNVPDPVALTVDPQGRVYVAATTRRKVADLDIRQHLDWVADDVGLDSVEAKRAFLKRELAPGKLRVPRGDLRDHNGDGLITWEDLTVHSERIYQLRDEDGDGVAERMTVFAEGFNTEVTGIAAGVLYHDGWVYATIAPDLWRLRDTDDDGVADEREVVVHGFGHHIAYAGHDMHGLRLGPDGRIYWSIGDKGVNVMSREGRRFDYPHEGAVMRVEPDGSRFEVFAHGLRNIQEIAFDAEGQVFGVDNDADMSGEKERLVWVVEGSDAGWRCSHQYMKTDSRWMRERIWELENEAQPLTVLPPLAHSHNGPAGFLWEPGTALGEGLRGRFLLNQFPSGEMSALRVAREGASYALVGDDKIHSGIMGIGMAWGPEGRFYMADWDGGYPLDEKGAVWHVDVSAGKDEVVRAEVLKLLREGMEKRDGEALSALLGHADQRVRIAAQLELVRREAFLQLAEVALDRRAGKLARLHALWGYGIGMRRGQVDALAVMSLVQAEEALLRANLAKVLGDAPEAAAGQALALLPLIADSDPGVRMQVGIALGKLREPRAVAALLGQAREDAETPVLRHALVTGLTGCAEESELVTAAADEHSGVRSVAMLALARQRSLEVARFLSDAEPRLVDQAARAIHDDGGMPELWAELAEKLDEPEGLSEMTLRRAMNAARRVGGLDQAARLVTVALDPTMEDAIRLEALGFLAEWRRPPPLDPVDGTALKLGERDASGAEEAMKEKVEALLALGSSKLKGAAIEALVALRVPVSEDRVAAMVADESAPSGVRAEALRMMAEQHPQSNRLSEALEAVTQCQIPEVLQQAGLELTARVQPDAMAKRLERLEATEGVRLQQAGLAAVAGMSVAPRDLIAWLEGKLAQIKTKELKDELHLDVLEAARALAREGDELHSKLAAYEESRASSDIPGQGPLRRELEKGGDGTRGREIVATHLGGNCLACHRVESDEGSSVGPALNAIGKDKDRRYLLEALVQPSATLAPGYGLLTVTLKSTGETLTGTVVKEDAMQLDLRGTDGSTRSVPLEEVASRTPPISVMPPMLGILTPREIRDVVAYLAERKGGKFKVKKDEH